MATLATRLIRWYHTHGRHDLPWQKRPTAYRVWVSEIMLQQTQVATVIDYYQRFMKSFPTLKALAMADIDNVLSHWSGLGYYARARNLHKTAQTVYTTHRGRFPKTVEGLTGLPGIGRSTAGAILSFAYQAPTPILDGNVKRVLARHFAVPGWYGNTPVAQKLWAISMRETPKKNTHFYNQAIMDLGASLCTRSNPQCARCPLQKTCQAHQTDQITKFPGKKPKKVRPFKQIRLLIFSTADNTALWLEKRPSKGIWGGLYSFPEYALEADLMTHCKAQWELSAPDIQTLLPFTHQFTHFSLEIHPVLIRCQEPLRTLAQANGLWYNLEHPLPGGIAAPVRKILEQLTLEPA